ncbi:ankyrin repeat-containing protein NPR4-like [Abrus precatorius]|uniref:Ankyrin repeat-containing protein NPR4-like n=1 Tax=Abrus precatorius TaxID=3816 RepID=A0A8B8K4V8_ABRPR|nr:ankyrin repeat-containing protein NPR4-like [Abrus precatorius]
MQDKKGYTALALAAELIDDEKIAECMFTEGGDELLSIATHKGEIPLLLAAAKGHSHMTRYLFSVTPPSVFTGENKFLDLLLSQCIANEIFDVATAIVQHPNAKLLSLKKSDGNIAPIYELASTPSAFQSGAQLNLWEQFMYKILIVKNEKIHAFEDERIEIVSHVGTDYEDEPNTITEDAMLKAAKCGIVEFIETMMDANPALLMVEDRNKRGIFSHAILNRQEKLFQLIKKVKGSKEIITWSTDKFENNMLHLAADLGPPPYLVSISNAALQMQRELQWFVEVKNIVPRWYLGAKNVNEQVPLEVFIKAHEGLLKDARQWAKDTSSSFTLIGTLITTIMFAAAFTVPGGNKSDNGEPILLKEQYFQIFIISDAISLITSSSSVLMFIGILTSRYGEEDFLIRLPVQLLFGLVSLFFSVLSMLIAFCAALGLMLRGHRRMVLLTMLLALLPILVFVPSLLRLFAEISRSTLRSIRQIYRPQ